MADDTKTFEWCDPETGEVIQIRSDALMSQMTHILMSRRKMQIEATIWDKLSQDEQAKEIQAAHDFSRDLVSKVVEIVAAADQICASVSVVKFTVDVEKNDITITSKGRASDDSILDLTHSKGCEAVLTVVDPNRFNRSGSLPKAEADQPELLPEDDEQDAPEGQLSDEDDTLHDEPEDGEEQEQESEPETVPEPEPEPKETPPEPDEPPFAQGHTARISGLTANKNPFSDPDEKAEWQRGFDVADDEISQLIEQGAAAREDGQGPDKNPFTGDAGKFWDEGYNAEKAAEKDVE